MADPTSTPRWLRQVQDALDCRAAGAILTMNTSDRVHLRDEDRVMNLRFAIALHFARQGYRVGYYASGLGFTELIPPGMTHSGRSPFENVPDSTNATLVLPALTRILRQSEPPRIVVIDYADHVAPAGQTGTESLEALQVLHAWGQDDDIRATRNFAILISYENGVAKLLTRAGAYRTIPLDLPGEGERLGFTDYMMDLRRQGYADVLGNLDPDLSTTDFARISSGLRLQDIEQLMRQGGARGSTIGRADVQDLKQQVIAEMGGDLVQIIEPMEGFEAVAGGWHAKRYFKLIRRSWMAGVSSVPQGLLLAGVPGCGKSHLVSAVAKEFECPLLVMRNIREAWVGASERNLETVLWIAENLSPCILWTDEIDQAIGQRSTGASGDSGTSERLLARIFEFFGSMRHRGRILWLATTNRPDILDAALLDRFQVSIPFIHPSRRERIELLPILARQVGREITAEVNLEELAGLQALDNLTVRSLQEILVWAGVMADEELGGVGARVQGQHLFEAISDYKPTFSRLEHEFIALKSLKMTPFGSLLPWMTTTWSPDEWPAYLDGLVNPANGALLGDALDERIRELETSRAAERSVR